MNASSAIFVSAVNEAYYAKDQTGRQVHPQTGGICKTASNLARAVC